MDTNAKLLNDLDELMAFMRWPSNIVEQDAGEIIGNYVAVLSCLEIRDIPNAWVAKIVNTRVGQPQSWRR